VGKCNSGIWSAGGSDSACQSPHLNDYKITAQKNCNWTVSLLFIPKSLGNS
jgi:hypothetical protein